MALERGYDLVEISPNAAPPVCKIMDYGKYKYAAHKKEQKTKKRHHQTRIKELRMRPITEEHDIQVKINHARKFITEGDKVLVTVQFKGRQITHKELGYALLGRVTNELADVAKLEKPITKEGYKLSIILAAK